VVDRRHRDRDVEGVVVEGQVAGVGDPEGELCGQVWVKLPLEDGLRGLERRLAQVDRNPAPDLARVIELVDREGAADVQDRLPLNTDGLEQAVVAP
jgi:hypothetical protein